MDINQEIHKAFIKLLFNKDWKYEEFGVMDIFYLQYATVATKI